MTKRTGILFSTVTASVCLTFLMLNRWIWTPLGEKSFGRLWQYYISYADVGFVRRGLVGTVLSETGLNRILSEEYVFSYLFYGLNLAALYALFIHYFLRHAALRSNLPLAIAVFLSPALFTHLAHASGCNDAMLLLIFAALVFYVSSIPLFALLSAFGILTHELFMFMLPALFMLKHLSDPAFRLSLRNRPLGLALIFIGLVSVAVVCGGALTMAQPQYEALMAAKMPHAAYQHPLWSGYFETASPVNSNYRVGTGMADAFWQSRWLIMLPTLYALLLAAYVARLGATGLTRLLLMAALLAPIAAQTVAGDYYRWVSMSASISLIGLCVLMVNAQRLPKRPMLLLLACFMLAGPFGGATLSRPFPMHQFVLEKLVGATMGTQ